MISVIVSNNNHAPFLSKRIDSILNQSYHDFELHGCSIDGSDN